MESVHSVPKHIIAVSAYVTNDKNEVLLVKTHWRSDTWELPGGQVEEGESLSKAIRREFLEETGIAIDPVGVTGIYYNMTKGILSVVFYGKYISGDLKIQPEEIKEACFVEINESNIDQYIVRPHMKSRTLDAIKKQSLIPYETWEINPYNLLERLEL